MPLSGDPSARSRQLANLKTTAARSHGAYSPAVTREHRTRFLAELVKAFPSASEAELTLQATRLARLETLAAYLDERGVIRNRRTGDVFAAASLEERITAAYERQHALLLARESTAGGRGGQPSALAAHLAQLEATAG